MYLGSLVLYVIKETIPMQHLLMYINNNNYCYYETCDLRSHLHVHVTYYLGANVFWTASLWTHLTTWLTNVALWCTCGSLVGTASPGAVMRTHVSTRHCVESSGQSVLKHKWVRGVQVSWVLYKVTTFTTNESISPWPLIDATIMMGHYFEYT